MLKNFKIRIAIWYSGLFTLIIAVTLFSLYKIISFQLKSEITLDLQNKTAVVNKIFAGEYINEEHGFRENQEHEKTDKSLSSLDLSTVKAYTEDTNNNYILLIYSENKLAYITEKYRPLSSHLNNARFTSEQLQDITIEGVPFSFSAITHSEKIIYLGYELSSIKNLQSKLLQVFLIVAPVSLLLSILSGSVVTQNSMNIIKRIDDTAKEITSTNLTKRIKETKSKDEISNLIITLNSMIDRLEKSFSQAKQFSQDAAHEIRTPLTIIRGEIEDIIENEQGNKNTINKLENILEEVHYLSSIAERLLLIHKMDTNNIKYHFERISLSKLLIDIFQDLNVLALNKSIKVDSNITDEIYVNGNKELLMRLFWNISDNAVKYNKPNGAVTISLSVHKSEIMVTISDTGIGISKSEIPKVFDRFYRVDKSRSRHLGGSGLGLSISKWIVDLHDGEIQISSEVDKGTTFLVKIPMPTPALAYN